MAKVLLVYPPYTLTEEFNQLAKVGNMQPPLGIAYLGAVLEKQGHMVKIIDAPPLGWGVKEIIEEAIKFKPQFIGLSVSTVDFNKAVVLAETLKKTLDVPVIIGGPHVTALPEEVLAKKCFDIGCLGEGERTIIELVAALENKRDLGKVQGIVFRQKGKIIRTPARLFIKNLDSLPYPARHLLPPLSVYHPTPATSKNFPVGTMITSRGCPYQCAFCFRGVFGNHCRFRSPENILGEIEILLNDFGAAEIRFWDDTFNADMDRIKILCRLILKRGLKFSWTCLARLDRLDRELLTLMKQTGCWQISYGIESGNDAVLARTGKGLTKKMITQGINLTYQTGIQSLGFFVLGLPGETKQTLEETVAFAKSLPLSVANFSIATPYPGTKLWSLAKSQGFLKEINYNDLVVNLPPKTYYLPEGLDSQTLLSFEKRAYREFYRHPSFILRQIKSIDTWGEFKRKVAAFFTIQSI